jgi:hypothetical protein
MVVASLATGTGSASAQGYSNAWCTDGAGRGNGGVLACAYATLAQCRAAASGQGMGCVRNPDYVRGSRNYRGRQDD